MLSAPFAAWLLSAPWLMSAGGSVATTAAGRPAGSLTSYFEVSTTWRASGCQPERDDRHRS